jgi:hypothetical protein
MTIFELYTANVPLLVPDAHLLRQLGCVCSLGYYGGGAHYGATRMEPASSVDFFIERADFYDAQPGSMPHVHTFSSLEELGRLLKTIDTRKTSAAMEEANQRRASGVQSAWQCLMHKAFPQALGASP